MPAKKTTKPMTAWMKHVLDTRKKHNCSFKEAMIKAKMTYKKK